MTSLGTYTHTAAVDNTWLWTKPGRRGGGADPVEISSRNTQHYVSKDFFVLWAFFTNVVYNDKVYWIVLLFQFSYCPPYKQITCPHVTAVPLVGGIYSWPHWHRSDHVTCFGRVDRDVCQFWATALIGRCMIFFLSLPPATASPR